MKHESQQEGSHRHYLALAIPLMLATISTPLLGAVDTAVVGYLEAPHYLGGVAIAALIFNTMYWLFGFLRVSTSGFTAQAAGKQDEKEMLVMLARPLLLASAAGIIFILAQYPLWQTAVHFLQPSSAVQEEAEGYFSYRIWGAPFALIQYVLLGWLIGRSHVNVALILQLGCNLLNMGLDVLFVFFIDMGASGIGLATLIAEITGVLIAAVYLWKKTGFTFSVFSWASVWEAGPFLHMIRMNRDLFIRTACLVTVFGVFTSIGTSFGEITLAANAILLQVHFIMAYFFDGLANASSILAGRATGKNDRFLFLRTMKVGAFWSFLVAVCWMLFMVISGGWFVGLFTSIEEVALTARDYSAWIILFPITAFWGLQLYGFFTGATKAAPVRNSVIAAMALFLLTLVLFLPEWGNHGLWLAFIVFTLTRTLVLWAYVPSLMRSAFMQTNVKQQKIM
ncbi:MATE family efflux transporter [Alteribacillus bidgolensis]|uniref:Multidrug resistance protein, MATE family n=1 Tax=Alteribacillus bidgolensis TaxID=930129 RepID=A0A1G8FZ00_9BACI|nr:MATE family efflux transporter [Alteribacillus bidgolensis]SDH87186.1 multidrug resistance protein, MATE family [Alteribacillus bidgolensis]